MTPMTGKLNLGGGGNRKKRKQPGCCQKNDRATERERGVRGEGVCGGAGARKKDVKVVTWVGGVGGRTFLRTIVTKKAKVGWEKVFEN